MHRFTKALSLFLASSLIVSAFGFSAPGNAKLTTKSTKSNIVVAGVVFQEDQFMKLVSIGYQDAAKKYGVKCLVGNTANDQSKETQLINTYMAEKVNGIAIDPLNQDSSVAALKKAYKSGMRVTITDTKISNASFISGGFISDNTGLGKSTGKIAAKFIKDKLHGKAKIAVVEFKSLLPQKSSQRVNGFLKEVKKLKGVTVVTDQDAWLQDKAVSVVGDILTAHPDVNIIYAANEGGTIGATMAVKNAGKAGKVFVFGIDASQQLASMLQSKDNILQAVTGQDPYSMGYDAMRTLINSIKGKKITTKGKFVNVPGVVLNRSNQTGIKAFLKDLKSKMSRAK